MTDDLDRIRSEVERRKQQAQQLGLPDLTTWFYRNNARFYPDWRGNHPEFVPQLISDIREVGEDTVEFTYQDHRYSLTWEEQSDTLSTLKLFVDGSRVLDIELDRYEYSYTEWRPKDVLAFIEGPWVSSFMEVVAEGQRLQQRAEQDLRRWMADDLRSRFGIAAETHHQASQSGCGPSTGSLPHPRQGAQARLGLQARLGNLLRWLFASRRDK